MAARLFNKFSGLEMQSTVLQVPDYSDLLGVHFVDFGRDVEKDGGLSCAGLCIEMFRRAGLKAIDPREDIEAAEKQWDVIEEGPFLPMDMFSLAREDQESSAHVAIHLGDWWILHSSDPLGVNKANLRNLPYWLDFAYRWKGAA